jgi:hypothetical protein
VFRAARQSNCRCPASCSSPRRCPPGRWQDRSASANRHRRTHRAAISDRRSSCLADSSRCGRRTVARLGSALRSWKSRHYHCRRWSQPTDRGDRRLRTASWDIRFRPAAAALDRHSLRGQQRRADADVRERISRLALRCDCHKLYPRDRCGTAGDTDNPDRIRIIIRALSISLTFSATTSDTHRPAP